MRIAAPVAAMALVCLAGIGLTQSKGAAPNAAKAAAGTQLKGPSGLPLPRFVNLKFGRVNVRKGPSRAHQVAWVFARKGLPVEIIAEFEHWRRVRDSEGEEGWVNQTQLAGGPRQVLVAPWRKTGRIQLFAKAAASGTPVAVVEPGALGQVRNCTGNWCRFKAAGFEGWVQQELLWGVYPGEKLP